MQIKEKIDKRVLKEILVKSWRSLEDKFKKNDQLHEHNFKPNKVGYAQNSPIRKLGSERYLQVMLFGEISKQMESSKIKDIVLSVEGKKLNSKRPDILGWNPSLGGIGKPYFIIEIKVTGNYLLQNKKKGSFKKEIKMYTNTTDETLFFFGCYYESDPSEINGILEKDYSLLKHFFGDDKRSFENRCIEGYAFRGDNKWKIVDNSIKSGRIHATGKG